ncbi:MAG TPA: hypothetical protein PLB05_04185, partial [Candidatus Omnitrophota bacterium]|nr:hypothetical protein [Candidatus Omnitrophota bacterium]
RDNTQQLLALGADWLKGKDPEVNKEMLEFELNTAINAANTIFERSGLTDSNPNRNIAQNSLSSLSSLQEQKIDARIAYQKAIETRKAAEKEFKLKLEESARQYNLYKEQLAQLTTRLMGENQGQTGWANMESYNQLAMRERLSRLARAPPVALVGTTLYIPQVGKDGKVQVLEMMSVNNQSMGEFGQMFFKFKDGELNSTQQFAFANMFGLGDLYVGAVDAQADGISQRYLVLSADTSSETSTRLINSLKFGITELAKDKQYYDQESREVKTKTDVEHTLLIIDSIGYKPETGKLYLGITGMYQVNTDTKDQVTGLHGMMKVEPIENTRIILEAGMVQSDGSTSFNVTDVLTGQSYGLTNIDFADSYNFQKITAELDATKNITLKFSVVREEERDGLLGNTAETYATVGSRVKLGWISVDAEKAINSDRQGARVTTKLNEKGTWNLSGFWKQEKDLQTYGGEVIYAGERWSLSGGAQVNPYSGDLEGVVRGSVNLPGGVKASAGVAGENVSGSIEKVIYRLGGKKEVVLKALEKLDMPEEVRARFESLVAKQMFDEALVGIQEYDANAIEKLYTMGGEGVRATPDGRIITYGPLSAQREYEARTSENSAGIIFHIKDKLPQMITEDLFSFARPLKYISDDELARAGVYKMRSGYYVIMREGEYKGTPIPLSAYDPKHPEQNPGDAMVILPADIRNYVASLPEEQRGEAQNKFVSSYPLMVEASTPLMARLLSYLRSYGYVMERGHGVVPLTEDMLKALGDDDISNGTIKGVQTYTVDENGEKVYKLEVVGLRVGDRTINGTIELGLQFKEAFDAITYSKFGMPMGESVGTLYVTKAQVEAMKEQYGIEWSLPREGDKLILSRRAPEGARDEDVFMGRPAESRNGQFTRRMAIELSKEFVKEEELFKQGKLIINGHKILGRIPVKGTLFDYVPVTAEDIRALYGKAGYKGYMMTLSHVRDGRSGAYAYYNDANGNRVYDEGEAIIYEPQDTRSTRDGYLPLKEVALKSAKGVERIEFNVAGVAYMAGLRENNYVVARRDGTAYFVSKDDFAALIRERREMNERAAEGEILNGRLISQVLKLDAKGGVEYTYYLGATIEKSEAVRTSDGAIFEINARGELVRRIATGSPVLVKDGHVSGTGTAKVIRTTIENEGEVIEVESYIQIRRSYPSNQYEKVFGVDYLGSQNLDFHPSPKTLPNGKTVAGKAIVGYTEESSRVIYYYDEAYNLLTRNGDKLTDANRGDVVGYAVLRSDQSIVLPAELQALLGRKLVVAEEQGYERTIKTVAEAMAMLGGRAQQQRELVDALTKMSNVGQVLAYLEAKGPVHQDLIKVIKGTEMKTVAEVVRFINEEQLRYIGQLEALLRINYFADVDALVAYTRDQLDFQEDMLKKFNKDAFLSIDDVIAYLEKRNDQPARDFRNKMKEFNLDTTKKVMKYLIGQAAFRSNIYGSIAEHTFERAFIIDAIENTEIAKIERLPDAYKMTEDGRRVGILKRYLLSFSGLKDVINTPYDHMTYIGNFDEEMNLYRIMNQEFIYRDKEGKVLKHDVVVNRILTAVNEDVSAAEFNARLSAILGQKNLMLDATRIEEIEKAVRAGIESIRTELGTEAGKLEFERTVVTRPYGLSSVDYRIKGDPQARVIFAEIRGETGKEIVLNTAWKASSSTHGYKISFYGLVSEVRESDWVEAHKIMNGQSKNMEVLGIYAGTKLQSITETPFMRVRVVKSNNQVEFEYRLIENMKTTRYIIPNDPLNRDIAQARTHQAQEVSIIKWWDSRSAYDLAPGQIVINTKIIGDSRVRETRYTILAKNGEDINSIGKYTVDFEGMEKTRYVQIDYNLATGVFVEERQYRDVNILIYYFDNYPLFVNAFKVVGENPETGERIIEESSYRKMVNKIYVDGEGNFYHLIREELATDDLGERVKKDINDTPVLLFKNGQRVYMSDRFQKHHTAYLTELSLDDLFGNSMGGQLINALRKDEYEALVELIEGKGQNAVPEGVTGAIQLDFGNAADNKHVQMIVNGKPVDRTYESKYGRNKWDYLKNVALPGTGVLIGGFAALVLLVAFLIPLFGNLFYQLRNRGKTDANAATVDDLMSMGFTLAQAQVILRERKDNGLYVSYQDFRQRAKTSARVQDQHMKSGNWFKNRIAGLRLWMAKRNASYFQYVYKKDDSDYRGEFDKPLTGEDIETLEQASRRSTEAFMEALGRIYGDGKNLTDAYKGISAMVVKYLGPAGAENIYTAIKAMVERMEGRISRQRAAQIILRKLYEKVRDTDKDANGQSQFERDIRREVGNLIEKFGFEQNFADQIEAIKETFLENTLNARLLPEGLSLDAFDVNLGTGLYAYAWDDLRKAPDQDRQITSKLISIEKLFVMQVIVMRSMLGLVGQGRAEEYIWAKYIEPIFSEIAQVKDNKEQKTATEQKLREVLPKIRFFTDVFQNLLNEEVQQKLEATRDPQGKQQNVQQIINEELYNDAFRYLLGLKDPSMEETGKPWLLSDELKAHVAKLRAEFEGILDTFAAKVSVKDRKAQVDEAVKLLGPVMKAFVNVVDEEIKMPVVKPRLSYWQLNVMPLVKILFNKTWRKRIFSKGGKFNMTARDLIRRLNNFTLIGVVTGLFAYLAVNAYAYIDFVGVASFIAMPWNIVLALGVAVLLIVISIPVLKLWRKSLTKRVDELHKSGDTQAAIKVETKKLFGRYKIGMMLFYGIQVVLVIGVLIFPWSAVLATPIISIPVVFKTVLLLMPYLLFVATWRLSFYAFNYLLMGIATWGYYFTNNV